MNFDYLKSIEQLNSLYETVTTSSNDSPFLRCIRYGKNIESLVRYVYSVKFSNYSSASSELIKLIKDRNFKTFLGKTAYYDKIHFIYLAGNNAAYDHEMDKETADLAFESLKEITYIVFSKLNEFTEEDSVKFEYKIPSTMVISEAKTRELYIDVNLRNAKYILNKDKDSRGHGRPVAGQVCIEIEVHNLPNQSVGYIDYVIYNKIGKPIAVIEAKRTSISEEAGSQQARDYADALKKELKLEYRPIIYYTNGYTIKIQDRLGYPARIVGNFASLVDLELMIKRQLPGNIDARKPIVDKTVDTSIINRSKLVEAVQEVIDSMNTDGKMRRKNLLVLPCGVGKTRTAVALSKILLKNDWAQNILFLADRNNLVTNAEKPFKKYIDGVVSDISAENSDRDISARVCICTYNSMLNFLNKPKKEFSVGHFDLIIVDEAHRSLFNVYRAIFEYFDSFILGLTATPSKALDRSTYETLDLNIDEPTFEVKFEEAVNLKYLVSYKAFDKTSMILKRGIKYDNLAPKEKEEFEEAFGTDVKEIEAKAFKKTISTSGIIVNKTTIDAMFEDLFAFGLRVDNGTKIGKTLIFAADHNHAERIVGRFNKKYSILGDDFCLVIDNQTKKNKTRQDNFAKKDSLPQIVVSVDMMDTGVDIPEIVNLVFFKRVNSRIKFDQMWGRGTRTCENLHVISPSKDYFEGRTKDDTRIEYVDKQGFFVFDYCDNFDFFNEHPEGNTPSNVINLNQKIYSLSLDVLAALQPIQYQEDTQYKAYYDLLKDKLVKKIVSLNLDRIDVHAQLAYVDKYKVKTVFQHLSNKDLYEIKTHLVRLIDADTTDDTCSKAWEYKLLIIQMSILDDRVDSSTQQMQVMKTAEALLQKASIPDIFKQKDVLKEIIEDEYYEHLDFFKLEELKTQVGPLIKYLEGEGSIELITGFNDKIETKERDSFFDFDDFRTFREKFMNYLKKHFGELKSVGKIVSLEPLNSTDLKELQAILSSLNKKEDEEGFSDTKELILFIRKIIGLDRTTIDKKCSEFLNENDFNNDQRQLINIIIDFAIRNGTVTNEDLVNAEPFCEIEIPELFENKLEPLFGLLSLFNNSLQVTA